MTTQHNDNTKILAWYFSNGREMFGAKRKQEVGKTYTVKGKIVPCENGLHGSVRAIDALNYGHGNIVWRVELWGTVVPHNGDKFAASLRTHLAKADATMVLHEFACWCAERALKAERKAEREPHPASRKAIKVKRQWMKGKATDEELDAARDAARAAARGASRDAARDAAWDAARAAAWDAAWAAARAAARGASRDAARAAAWDAARAAAWAAAWAAARAAAWDAAWDAARDAQNKKLEVMLNKLLEAQP